MAGAMLVLFAACRVPALRNVIGPDVLTAGEHLRKLLEEWKQVVGGPESPSVEQSLVLIIHAGRLIRQVYESQPHDMC